MANTAELQQVLDSITADIDSWNQGFWVTPAREAVDAWEGADRIALVPICGTRYCAAGNVAISHGYRFIARWSLGDTTAVITAHQAEQLKKTGTFKGFASNVEAVASEILGLEFGEADAFFSATNELIDLWALAWAFTDGGLTLPEDGIPAVTGDEHWGRHAQPAYASAAVMRANMDERLRGNIWDIESVDAYLDRTAPASC